MDRVEALLPEALAWIPQSTVAITINKGWLNLVHHLPQVKILLQVHDSLVFQYPISEHPYILPEIKKQLAIVIPYDDPLTIPVTIKTSTVSWGDCS
jgi:DNA polymerase I-like protein with 3'-5' exonuclease and polymerase domains